VKKSNIDREGQATTWERQAIEKSERESDFYARDN